MKKVKINYSEDEYYSFCVDLDSYEENLTQRLKMINNSVDMRLKGHMDKSEINEWIESLEDWKLRAESLKSLKKKIKNNATTELTDNEYHELIRSIWEEIEHGKYRLDDYKSGRFGWGEKLIPVETADIERRIALYERLEGKKYTLNSDSNI
jgi:predicted DNA-binding protein